MNNTKNEIIMPVSLPLETKYNKKLVQGVGINDYDGTIKANGKCKSFYIAWSSMLGRCYSPYYQAENPSYIGCTVANEWLSLKTFKEWHDENYVKDYHLDKDLINPGNQVYSSGNCVYIPQALNKLFLKPNAKRALPYGVTSVGRRFRARLGVKNKRIDLGIFDTPDDASNAYRNARLIYVFDELQEYLKNGVISIRTMNTILSNAVNGLI